MRNLWLEVSDDEYELPVAVADSAEQLSRMTGRHPHAVLDMVSKHKRGLVKKCRFVKVRIDDDDTEM